MRVVAKLKSVEGAEIALVSATVTDDGSGPVVVGPIESTKRLDGFRERHARHLLILTYIKQTAEFLDPETRRLDALWDQCARGLQ